MLKMGRARAVFLFILLLVVLRTPGETQETKSPQDYVPPELQASDPEVKAYLEAADRFSKEGNLSESFLQLQQALDLCLKKKLSGDEALLEAQLGSSYFMRGRLADAKDYFLKALSNSIKTGNLVLQADTLAALSGMEGAMENQSAALDLATRAVDIANKSNNLFIQSRCLGVWASVEVRMGKIHEGRAALEKALQIDRLNQYRWEASHLLDMSQLISLETPARDQALKLALSVRQLSVKYEDYLTFMLASIWLVQSELKEGHIDEAIHLIEASRNGISDDGKPLFQHPAAFRATVSLPFTRVLVLGITGTTYEAGKRIDDALITFKELYEAASTSGFILAQAAAAQELGTLYQQKKDVTDAIRHYSLAAELWEKSGNTERRIDALASKALVLLQDSQTEEALQDYEMLLPLVKANKDTRRNFLFNIFIAELVQSKGDLERAEKALTQAEALLTPDLTLPGVAPESILEMYVRLAGVHEKKNEQLPMLIAIEKAMTPAEAAGKADMLARLDQELERDLIQAHVREKAKSAYETGDLSNGLVYFELLQHFEETVARHKGQLDEYKKNPDNQPLQKIFEIPLKLMQQANGPATLEANLQEMGPIAERIRFGVLALLTDYYTREEQPDKIITFASAALPYLQIGENNQPKVFDVQVACELAYALLLRKEISRALERMAPCLNSAKKLGDARLLGMAHQINVFVLQAAGREKEAEESNQYLMQHAPDDPRHYVELAQMKMQERDYVDAVHAWKKALGLFEARKDQRQAAYVYLSLADSLRLGNPGTAEERAHLEAALSIYRQLNDAEAQARANVALGTYFGNKKDLNPAQKYFDAALQLSRQVKNQPDEAYALAAMGDAYRTAEKPTMALDCYRKAAEIYHQLNDTGSEAFQLRSQSQALDDLHKPEEAIAAALKAKSVADTSASWSARYWVRRYLSALYSQRGDYLNALAANREAQSIATAAGQPLPSSWAGLSLAIDLTTVGEWEDALNALTQALPIVRQFHDTASEIEADSLLVDVYAQRESDLQDFDKAFEYYRAALQLAEKTDPSRKAGLAMSLEEGLWQQKRYKEAKALINEALTHYVQSKNAWGQANALLSLAEVQRLQGDVQSAAATLTRAEPFVKQADDLYMTGRLYYSQAAQKTKEGRFKEAIAEYERVIGMLEQFKSTADAGMRRKTSESYGYIYDELAEAWYSLGQQNQPEKLSAADKALQYAELNKSRVFTTSWGRTFVDGLKRQLPAPLQERERSLAARQGALQAELEQSLSGHGTRPAKQAQDEIKRAADEEAALEREIRAANPAYAEARYPRPVSIAGLPLRRGELFVEFKMLQESLLVWMIEGTEHGPNLAAFYKVERPREWFMEKIAALRRPFNRADPDQFDPKLSEELFRNLFPAPYAQKLLTAQSIIFAPDDALFLLPFEILSPTASQSSFALLNTPVTYFPSAAALRLARTVSPVKREWTAQFFGIADPITSEDDERYTAATVAAEVDHDRPSTEPGDSPLVREPVLRGGLKGRDYIFERLPDTAKEVNSIAGLFTAEQSAVVRTGLEARKRELLQTDLGRFRFVHFATHGFMPVEPGIREPALILSYDGKDEERMMLTLSEIIQLKLHAEMVVLSACNTGTGKVTRAEGVSSLGTAFLAAGASSVMMSLWKVADESTAILMQEFYKNLLNGMPKSKALAAARATIVSKGYKNPFFWAPFVLTGE